MNQPLNQKGLPHFVKTSDILYQKEKGSATGNGDQSKPPVADDADTGNIYNYE